MDGSAGSYWELRFDEQGGIAPGGEDAAALVEYAPVWRFVYVPMVLLAVTTAILHVVDFVRPYRARSRELTRVAINVASLFLMLFLSQAGDLFFPRVSSALPEAVNVPRVVDIINAGFRIGIRFRRKV